MAQLDFVDPLSARSEAAARTATSEMKLDMEEAFASPRRIWLRGRLTDLPSQPTSEAASDKHWWEVRRRQSLPSAIPSVHLETRVNGQVLTTEIQPAIDGRFEATFTADLPVSKRGWRLARNRVTCLDQTAEKCALVIQTPERARTAVVVIVPSAAPIGRSLRSSDGNCRLSSDLTQSLCNLEKEAPGRNIFYYLSCVPKDARPYRAELSLATAAWGWPAGNLVLFAEQEGRTAHDLLRAGIDLIRWLFADSLEVVLATADDSFSDLLKTAAQPAEDRAPARELRLPIAERKNCLEASPPSSLSVSLSGLYRPTRAAHIPRHPVVFCHGMMAFTTLHFQLPADLNCFRPLREYLQERGFRVLFPQVAPTSGVVARAAELRDQIRRWTDEPVNVIAHSMGGLDARYMITHLGMAKQVRCLTTVATPHRGTHLVDWFLTNFHKRVPLLRAFEALGVSLDGFRDCRPSACVAFNASTPDMPGVKYFSYGGSVPVSRVTPVLRRAWTLLSATEGPNDGMVSEASAHWGEYVGTVHADHFAQTPDMTFVRPGEDFDAAGFYCGVLEDLARRGF